MGSYSKLQSKMHLFMITTIYLAIFISCHDSIHWLLTSKMPFDRRGTLFWLSRKSHLNEHVTQKLEGISQNGFETGHYGYICILYPKENKIREVGCRVGRLSMEWPSRQSKQILSHYFEPNKEIIWLKWVSNSMGLEGKEHTGTARFTLYMELWWNQASRT